MLYKSRLIPPKDFEKMLNNSASIKPRTKPIVAKIKGIAISAPKAKTVPQLNPGVSMAEAESKSKLTKMSIRSPPKEYKIPSINPTSPKRTA